MYDIDLIRGTIKDADAVRQSLINLLSTKKGTIPHNRDFGTNFEKYLFDLDTLIIKKIVAKEVEYLFSKYLYPLKPTQVNVSFIEGEVNKTMEIDIQVLIDGRMTNIQVSKTYKR